MMVSKSNIMESELLPAAKVVKEDLNIMKLKRYTLSTPLICLMLISCGGGGGGSGGGALVQTPTPTYTEYVDFVNNGGTVPSVQGQILRSRPQGSSEIYTDTEFDNFSSITLQYSVPDANGNQSISMSGRVNWDGDPFSGSDTFTETLDSNDYYDLFLDDHLASVYSSEGGIDFFTIGFVDFGGLRTVEQTKYVTQLLQFRRIWPAISVGGFDFWLSYDFLAFVMGDQTWASDIPSSGSATYNGFTQMLFSNEYNDEGLVAKYYAYGNSTFTANFANRDITGRLDFEYIAWADEAESGVLLDDDELIILDLNGTISGTSFSGTVTDPYLTDPGDITSSFTGNFYGPNATELGGIFNYSNENYSINNDGDTGSLYTIGTFTGCQGC